MARNAEYEKLVESDTDSGSTESDSDQQHMGTAKKSSSLPPVAGKKSKSQSSLTAPETQISPFPDEEESKTESDQPHPKPVASKPKQSSQKSSGAARSKSKPNPSDPDSVKSTGAKRAPEDKESETMDAKRSKQQQQPETEIESSEEKSVDGSKRQLFQRLWSEDDEIAILKGMIDYAEKKESDPVADLDAFYEFIKGVLNVDVSRAQLQTKIRRLKKKYVNNKSKEKDGKHRVFSKPHENKAYELSKLIWRNGSGKEIGGEELTGSSNVEGKFVGKNANAVEEEDLINVEVPSGDPDLDLVNMEMVPKWDEELAAGDKRTEVDLEWKMLRIRQVEIYLEKLNLMRAQTRLVLDVLKSRDH